MKNTVFKPCDICLPYFSKNSDLMQKYAIIACDQYTSEAYYWENAENIRRGYFSALDLILPEIDLAKTDSRTPVINDNMKIYEKQVYVTYPDSMIYVERVIPKTGKVRSGIVGAIDLESYEFTPGAASKVRATEGTVAERIPPRVKIRKDATLELPHVMVFCNDAENKLFSYLAKQKESFEKLYDFELMQNSGRITGYLLGKDALDMVDSRVSEYCLGSDLVFAVGDGNHSLATAKTCYENLKKELGDAALDMPARYALCEIVNIHDEAVEFEPIYRLITNIAPDTFVEAFSKEHDVTGKRPDCPHFEYTLHFEGLERKIYVKNPKAALEVGELQEFLDAFLKGKNMEIDYIHGLDSLSELSKAPGNLGISFRGMEKGDLFSAVEKDGSLPRKTFSMGEARDKRFYIEARRIK